MVQVCWTLENGGTTMSERFRALGFDPARVEDVFRYVNTPYPGSGPQPGKHRLGIDYAYSLEMKVCIYFISPISRLRKLIKLI